MMGNVTVMRIPVMCVQLQASLNRIASIELSDVSYSHTVIILENQVLAVHYNNYLIIPCSFTSAILYGQLLHFNGIDLFERSYDKSS